MRTPAEFTKFEIPKPLWPILRDCETVCVGGCCGRKAFDFSAETVGEAAIHASRSDWTRARVQLDELIATLAAVRGRVYTLMIADRWNGAEASEWFSRFRKALDDVAGS